MIQNCNELLASIIDDNTDPFFSCDLNGTVNTWNAAARDVFGYANDDAIGRHVCFLFHRKVQEKDLELLVKIFIGKKIDYYETTHLTSQGTEVFAGVTLSPIISKDGRLFGASYHCWISPIKKNRIAAILDF